MSKLKEKMKKSGSIKNTTFLSDTTFFKDPKTIPTDIPILNIAFSGEIDKGFTNGLTFLAGESRNFKSITGLLMVKAYLNYFKDSDPLCIFYDSEFGITPDYFNSLGINPDDVLHIPIENIEQIKFDIAQRLDDITKEDNVIIFIDSIGNLASKKEAVDALEGKDATDMTRAKTLKSLWRIVTPHLTTKEIPCIAVNHVYSEQKMYGKTIMSGGQGGMLSANQVLLFSKSQEKEGSDLVGYSYNITIDKSRYVREKSKFSFIATFEEGIQKYSGLMDIALESGIVIKPNQGWYQRVINETTGELEEKKWRLKDTNIKEFWDIILKSNTFKEYVKKRYKLGVGSIMTSEDDETVENTQKVNSYENA